MLSKRLLTAEFVPRHDNNGNKQANSAAKGTTFCCAEILRNTIVVPLKIVLRVFKSLWTLGHLRRVGSQSWDQTLSLPCSSSSRSFFLQLNTERHLDATSCADGISLACLPGFQCLTGVPTLTCAGTLGASAAVARPG